MGTIQLNCPQLFCPSLSQLVVVPGTIATWWPTSSDGCVTGWFGEERKVSLKLLSSFVLLSSWWPARSHASTILELTHVKNDIAFWRVEPMRGRVVTGVVGDVALIVAARWLVKIQR